MSKPLVDDLARETATTSFDKSVFLEAGAGTGKSSTLVKRVVQTLEAQICTMREVVAITFTEKAAAELRFRIRAALEQGVEKEALAAALKEVDAAQIGTIHSFAQYILRRFALEAKLPLGFTVCDEVEAAIARRQRARDVIGSLSDLRRIDHTLRLYKVKMANLLDLVQALDSVSLRITSESVDPLRGPDLESLRMKAMTGISRFIMAFELDCVDENDKLAVALKEKSSQLLEMLGSAGVEQLAMLHINRKGKRLPQFKLGNIGSKKAYGQEPRYWRHGWADLESDVNAVLVAPLDAAIRELLQHAHTELERARDTRREAGLVEFDDLLYLAEALVTSDLDVRRRLFADFKVLMIDEFQDTDPLQWKLISTIASNPDVEDSQPEPGRLVLVGDPKQAIYSFRGADIETFTAAQREFTREEESLGLPLSLKSNFRTVKPIITWVNETFSTAFARNPSQVGYEPLEPVHDISHDQSGPSVTILREASIPEEMLAKQVEASLVAGQIQRAVAEGWMITDRDGDARRYSRPATYRDIAVLFPTRSSLDSLLNSFDDAGIPYRSSDAALIFDRPVVVGTVHALRSIVDPTNELSMWLALKTPLFGCTDQELKDYYAVAQTWKRICEDEAVTNSRVKLALKTLEFLRRDARDSQPVELINALLEKTRIFEVLMHTPRGNFDADALRMLLIHAQMWQADGGVGLVQYVETLEMLKEDSSRAQFPMADDREDDAIELMTVFGAKGLEFPIVLLAGMTTKPKAIKPLIGISKLGPIQFCLNAQAMSVGYDNWFKGEHTLANDAERMRVLYVACTRPRDHLVVSLVGGTTNKTKGSPGALLREFVPARSTDVHEVPEVQAPALQPKPQPIAAPADWHDRLKESRKATFQPWVALPSGTGAQALGVARDDDTTELDKVIDDDSTQRMNLSVRDGAAFGQVVHAAMDFIFRSGRQVSEELITEAVDYGMSLVTGIVDSNSAFATVKAITASPSIVEALNSPRKWPELYLATPTDFEGVTVVEGLADLVYESSPGHFVVVDYKTDQTISEMTFDHYRDQLACYAEIMRRITGHTVEKCVIVHAANDTATEHVL